VTGDDLVIGTHGRSFYILDNISILRQITSRTTEDAVVLFDPADATRSVSRGVMIDYYLQKPADQVRIEFLDASGTLVRGFTSAPETGGGERGRVGAAPATPVQEGGGRGGPPARVSARQGMNRFTWDMRYPDARTVPGMILWAASTRGPVAPPGRYQVKLTANGVTKTQDVEIRRNAAVTTVTDADLLEQFKLAKQISDKVTAANDAVIRIRQMKDQIADRVAKAADDKMKQAGTVLAERLTEVEGEMYQHRNRSSQDPLNYPIRLNNKLAALQGTVESGDYKPTDQSYAVFKELSGRLDKEFARLDSILKTDVAAFNTLLAGAKLPPIGN
jgi:hypothetical protein